MSELTDLYKEITRLPLPLPDRYHVDYNRWLRVREEIEELPVSKRRGVLCYDIDELNYLVAGIPVCFEK